MNTAAPADALRQGLPPGSVLPDPTRDIVQLVRAIAGHLGRAPRAPAGAVPPSDFLASLPLGRPHVVLLLVDGLGDRYLARTGGASLLHRHRLGDLSSVFPSTTASAIASVMTGLWPIHHGLLGWFIRDARFGGILAPLPMTLRAGGKVEGVLRLRRLFPYPTLYQGLPCRSTVVSPREIVDSPFNRRHSRGAARVGYQGLDGLVAAIRGAVLSHGRQGGYVYAYYARFDAMTHAFGVDATRVAEEFGKIQDAVGKLADGLAGLGVDLLVTADHGFIDVPAGQTLDIADWPEIPPMLAVPMWGERRVAWCAVRSGAALDFEAAITDRLGSRGRVLPMNLVPPGMLFGFGRPSGRLRERMGSHGLFMAPGWAVRDRVAGEVEHPMIGLHGGLSADEMRIPLVHIDCG